jgi:hypothetical protein
LACTYRVKFVEVSVGINHNVDELLAGTLTQIRLKRDYLEIQVPNLFSVILSVNFNVKLIYRVTKKRAATGTKTEM